MLTLEISIFVALRLADYAAVRDQKEELRVGSDKAINLVYLFLFYVLESLLWLLS